MNPAVDPMKSREDVTSRVFPYLFNLDTILILRLRCHSQELTRRKNETTWIIPAINAEYSPTIFGDMIIRVVKMSKNHMIRAVLIKSILGAQQNLLML